MLFTPVVLALTAWQSHVSAAAVDRAAPAMAWTAPETDCLTAQHAIALSRGLSHLYANSSKKVDLPIIPEQYQKNPSACLPPSLGDLFVEPVVQFSKENDLVSQMDSLFGAPYDWALTTREEQQRPCSWYWEAAKNRTRSYSCDSAPHPDRCRSCAKSFASTLLFGCLGCAAKFKVYESPVCCAGMAAAFWTGYSQICLDK
ncbi:hypothetical protein E4U41_004154 [Claviceps citrina]|nr:hypothetical protein E4U41_004154 [Claviceps citrina]